MNKKVLIILSWIFLLPIMIWYTIFKSKKIKKKPKIAILSVYSLILLSLFNSSSESSPAIGTEDNLPGIVEESQSQEVKQSDVYSEEITVTKDEVSNTQLAANEITEKEDGLQEEQNIENSTDSPDAGKGHETSDLQTTENDVNAQENEYSEVVDEDVLFEGYSFIEVDGGDLSGYREANVVVDIGFGDRKYYAFTNEYGQLVKVIADVIILQDGSAEQVTDQGRYFPDEAKVPGTESPTLDEGHVIADSLGGVANAYNITPQDSTLNRYGDQAYMEKVIRDAGGCSDFTAIITYPDTITQIPSHYSFTYTLMGTVINDEFDNVNPDDSFVAEVSVTEPVVEDAVETVSEPAGELTVPLLSLDSPVFISDLKKRAEYVVITNNSSLPVNISSWRILSEKGSQDFYFPVGTVLGAGASFKVTSSDANGTGDFIMANGNIWNNSSV